MTFRKVNVHGANCWFDREYYNTVGHAPLAMPHHVKDGELDLDTCFYGDSYAHVYSTGAIMRYHRAIGTPDDIKDGWVEQPAGV